MKEAHVGDGHVLLQPAQRPVRVREQPPAPADPAQATGASRATCSPTTAPPTTRSRSLNNGLDFEPWPAARLPAARDQRSRWRPGWPPRATLDEHVRAILRTWFRVRLLRPRRATATTTARSTSPPTRSRAAHRGVGGHAARNGNGRCRWTPPAASIAVIGTAAAHVRHRRRLGQRHAVPVRRPARGDPRRAGAASRSPTTTAPTPSAAVADARAADVAIVFAGDYDTEGADRPCLTLECPPTNGNQDGLIAQRRGGQPAHRRRARDAAAPT